MEEKQISLAKYRFDIGSDALGFTAWVVAANKQEAVLILRHRVGLLLEHVLDRLHGLDAGVKAYFEPEGIQEDHIYEVVELKLVSAE